MENRKAIVSDVKEAIRNAFVKIANALSGCEGSKNKVGGLKEIERLFQLEDDSECLQKRMRTFGKYQKCC